MKTIELSSWADFLPTLEKIKSKYGHYPFAGKEHKNVILYRGQAKADEWHLKTTLERFSDKRWSVRKYATLANRCGPEVESFIDRSWNLLSWKDLNKKVDDYDTTSIDLPDYSFWVYLRQHGFPSPLLDWTRSPYIAAFFAAAERKEAGKVAVFAYVETPKGVKGGYIGAKTISVLGPNVKTDRRHFLQQCWYTICTERKENEYQFIPHEDALAHTSHSQDVLIKITIPSAERIKMLQALRLMNITQFSLFQTEEGLVRTLAFDKIEQPGL